MRPAHLAIAICLCTLLGCGDITRLRDCQRITAAVNPALDQLESVSDKVKHPQAKTYEDLADRYEALRNHLLTLQLHDEDVIDALGDYTDMLAHTEKQLRASGRAVSGKLKEKDQLRRHEQLMQPIKNEERGAISRLKSACRP